MVNNWSAIHKYVHGHINWNSLYLIPKHVLTVPLCRIIMYMYRLGLLPPTVAFEMDVVLLFFCLAPPDLVLFIVLVCVQALWVVMVRVRSDSQSTGLESTISHLSDQQGRGVGDGGMRSRNGSPLPVHEVWHSCWCQLWCIYQKIVTDAVTLSHTPTLPSPLFSFYPLSSSHARLWE